MPTRGELWSLIHQNGGQTRDTMAKSVEMLLVGTGYGKTKLDYARKKGMLTCSLSMWDQLGMFQEYGEWSFEDTSLREVVAELILQITFLCEVLYAHSVGAREPSDRTPEQLHYLGRMFMLSAGVERLLQDAFEGCDDRDNGDASPISITIVHTTDEARASLESCR